VAGLSEEVDQGIETSFAAFVSRYGAVPRRRQQCWQFTAAKSGLSYRIELSRHRPLVDKSDRERSAGTPSLQ